MSTRTQIFLVVAQLCGVGWSGCRSATRSLGVEDCAEEVRCPSLLGVPCNNGAAPGLHYYYCDRCGQDWDCGAWEGYDARFSVWNYGGYGCDCLTEDFDIDTHNPVCGDTY